ncbi:STAS domain-containing protein [Streptomyces sp. NPDC008150]|uniref:STAS domain-containing protein n=1 Tax=Streptomyces sp. NPDC008150 TaxID=3364816 RepID=UPI0036EBFA14
MTALPPRTFDIAVTEPAVLTVTVGGVLDYDTSDELVSTVTELLARPGEDGAPWRDLRLDCAGLTWLDSMGLAALLMIRRRAGASSVTLHLDNRPGFLDRMLELTDTFGYLTEQPESARDDVPEVSDVGAN